MCACFILFICTCYKGEGFGDEDCTFTFVMGGGGAVKLLISTSGSSQLPQAGTHIKMVKSGSSKTFRNYFDISSLTV